MLMPRASRELTHFIELARRGRYGGASEGELRAYRLARAMIDNAPNLDEEAISGALWFLRVAKAANWKADDFIEGKGKQRGE